MAISTAIPDHSIGARSASRPNNRASAPTNSETKRYFYLKTSRPGVHLQLRCRLSSCHIPCIKPTSISCPDLYFGAQSLASSKVVGDPAERAPVPVGVRNGLSSPHALGASLLRMRGIVLAKLDYSESPISLTGFWGTLLRGCAIVLGK
jgi:hypothetical protein